MSNSSKNQDSVLGDYVLQLQKQKEERERKRREHEAEIERHRQAEEARKKAEEERLRKEAEERKRAKEAKILAEQQAELRRQNLKKVRKAALISLAIFLLIFGSMKVYQAVATKRAIAEANVVIEQVDALVAKYQFDEAQNICESGLRKIDNEKARRIVLAKETDIRNAKQNADAEYESALRKSRILLDADDNKFNKYSNECLDKMIQIYPDRKETIYYKNLRK